jgi:hypothetical protein
MELNATAACITTVVRALTDDGHTQNRLEGRQQNIRRQQHMYSTTCVLAVVYQHLDVSLTYVHVVHAHVAVVEAPEAKHTHARQHG